MPMPLILPIMNLVDYKRIVKNVYLNTGNKEGKMVKKKGMKNNNVTII